MSFVLRADGILSIKHDLVGGLWRPHVGDWKLYFCHMHPTNLIQPTWNGERVAVIRVPAAGKAEQLDQRSRIFTFGSINFLIMFNLHLYDLIKAFQCVIFWKRVVGSIEDVSEWATSSRSFAAGNWSWPGSSLKLSLSCRGLKKESRHIWDSVPLTLASE